MSTYDDRNRQQGTGSQQDMQQGTRPQQQGGVMGQAGGQQDQFSPGRSQQGGSQQPGSQQPGSQQSGVQQGGSQQGASVTRRGGGAMPSLFGAGRSNPFELLRRLDEDMDRLFHQVWTGGRAALRGRGSDMQTMWVPQVELAERDGKLHVYADLPGLRKEDVKVSMEGDQLVLQGERRSERDEEDQQGGYFHSERSYGSFYRSIPLPEGVDPATVDASFRDGVLDVCFDAPRTQQRRQIEIRDAGGSSGSSGSSSGS